MDIEIPTQRVPVLAESYVLVCGAGCAGIAAAISAARHGWRLNRDRVLPARRWPIAVGFVVWALLMLWLCGVRALVFPYGVQVWRDRGGCYWCLHVDGNGVKWRMSDGGTGQE